PTGQSVVTHESFGRRSWAPVSSRSALLAVGRSERDSRVAELQRTTQRDPQTVLPPSVIEITRAVKRKPVLQVHGRTRVERQVVDDQPLSEHDLGVERQRLVEQRDLVISGFEF